MKLNDWDMFRLEDRVLFEAAAAAEIVDAAEAAQDNPNANVSESEKQAQEEREALKNAPPENPSQARPNGESQNIPGEPAGIDAELDKLINGEIGSADLAADAVFSDPGVENGDVPTVTVDFIDRGGTVSTGRELVVINSSVADADDIVASLKPNQEALLLDPDRDAMEQINDYFDRHDGVKYEALHILSHGNDGYFVLNGEVFNAENFDAAEWAEVGEHLTGGGDILLYGCNLADGKAGRELIGLIADASGADVAASDDATGVSGDWELEYRFGTVEAESIAVDGYMHNLTNYLVVNENSSGEGSFAWAVGEANKNGGTDEITFDSSVSSIQFSSALNITDGITISGNLDADGCIATTFTVSGSYRILSVNADVAVEIRNIAFERTGGSYSNDGGLIFNSGDLTLNNTSFSNGKGRNGGAIYNGEDGTLVINRAVFSSNKATSGGGAVINYGNAAFSSVQFENNNAKFGGAILNIGDLRISDAEFNDNQATSHGGAVYGSEGSVVVAGSVFCNNSSGNRGGGIYAVGGSYRFVDAVFQGNSASKSAGAVWIGQSGTPITMHAERTVFKDNHSAGDGGALYITYSSEAVFSECVWENNTAYYGNSRVGSPDATCGGGAIFIERTSSLTIQDSLLQGNRDEAGHAGSAICSYSGSRIAMVNTTLYGNSGSALGTLYNPQDGTLSLVNVTVSGNGASGGAIYNAGGAVAVLNSILTGNGGLDVYSSGGKFDMRHSVYGTADGFKGNPSLGNLAGETADIFENGGVPADNGGRSDSIALRSSAAARMTGADVRLGYSASGQLMTVECRTNGTWQSMTAASGTVRVEQLQHDQRGYLYGDQRGNAGAFQVSGYIAWSGEKSSGDGMRYFTTGDLQAALNDDSVDTLHLANTRILLDADTCLTVERDITITGDAADRTLLVRKGATGIFAVSDGTLTVSGLSMNGNAENVQEGGALKIAESGKAVLQGVTLSGFGVSGDGGAIWNAGELVLSDSALINNSAVNGGAVFNSGKLVILSSTLADNTAKGGKGSAVYSSGSATLVNTTITAHNDDLTELSGGVYAATGSELLGLDNLAVSNGAHDFLLEGEVKAGLKYNILSHADGLDATNQGGAAHSTEFLSGPSNNGGGIPTIRLAAGALAAGERALVVGRKGDAFYFSTDRDTGNMQWQALNPEDAGFVTRSAAETVAICLDRDGRGASRLAGGFYGAGAFAPRAFWAYYFTDPARDAADVLNADVYLYLPEQGGVDFTFTNGMKDYDRIVDKTIYLADAEIRVENIKVGNDLQIGNTDIEFHFVGGENTVLTSVSALNSIFTIRTGEIPDDAASGPNAVFDTGVPHVAISIENVTMTRDIALKGNGGAVHVTGDVELAVRQCEFSDCTVSGMGGAIFGMSNLLVLGAHDIAVYGPSISIEESVFCDCSAQAGGAIYIDDNMAGSKVDVAGGVQLVGMSGFTQNVFAVGRAEGDKAGRLILSGSRFENNNASIIGGAVAVAPLTSGRTIESANGRYSSYVQMQFSNSVSYYRVEISDSVFTDNHTSDAYSGGGAIFYEVSGRPGLDAFNFELTDSVLSGNSTGNYGGGAVYFSGYTPNLAMSTASINVSGNTITNNNTTGDGGAIRLTENTSGGGPYPFFAQISIEVLPWVVRTNDIVLSYSVPTVARSLLYGGSASVEQMSVTGKITLRCELNSFSENTAEKSGGVLSADIKSIGVQIDLINSTLAFNAAGTNGGAIDTRYEMRLNLIDSTVACNTAANGGISADGVVVNVINSIVLGNGGGEFAVANGGEIHTAYSIYGREAAGTVATDTHSQYAVLNEVFGKDLLAASDLTAYGTLAISAAGLAFTSGTQVAKVGDDFYFLQDGAWVDMKGNTTTVSRADYIMAAQDSSAANGIVRVETSRGGFNVGAHAMVEISVEVSTEKSYDGTTAAPVDGNGGYIYSVDGIVSTNDGLLIGAERVELEQLEYTDKNAGRDIPLNVKGVLGGFEDGSLYIVTFSGKGDIHKAQLTVTGNTDTQIYNGKEYTADGWSDVSGLVAGDILQSVSGIAAGTDVGEYDQVLSDAVVVDADCNDMSGNYEISYIDGKLTINPAKVVVTVDAGKTYDGTTGYDVANGNHTVTVNSDESGLLDADDFALESFEYGGKNVGKYTGADGTNGSAGYIGKYGADNFIIDYVYTGTIRHAVITVDVNAEKVYDANTRLGHDEADYALAGRIGNDDVDFDMDSLQAEYADANVHSGRELTGMAGCLTGGDSGNYILVLTGKGSVTPRHVTVTADEQSKQRGDDDPILTWKHTGGVLLEGDSIDGTLVREPGEEVGDYTILNDTLQVNNPNYILHYVENLLHITENPRDNQPERIPDSSINEWQQPYIYNLNYTMSTEALGPGSAGFYWEPRGIYRFEAPTSVLDPIPDGENSVSGSLNLREADDSLEDYLEIGGVRWETILNRHTAFKDDFELLLDDYIGDAFYENARAEAEMAKFSRALY